jgi:hypothetical protein
LTCLIVFTRRQQHVSFFLRSKVFVPTATRPGTGHSQVTTTRNQQYEIGQGALQNKTVGLADTIDHIGRSTGEILNHDQLYATI